MKLTRHLRRINLFAVVETLLTVAALTLVATTVGSRLGPLLGLTGHLATVVGWSVALVYDALWIGALRMSEAAIRQRSRLGMGVMLGLSTAAVAVSTSTLFVLGHARVFAFVPLAAALFMGLRLFAAHVLADPDTAATIAAQDAADRREDALSRAAARSLRAAARREARAETAEHLAEVTRQTARAEALTDAEVRLLKVRAKAEEKLREAGEAHGELAAAFAARPLALTVTAPGTPVTPTETRAVTVPAERPAPVPPTPQQLALDTIPSTPSGTAVTPTDTQASIPAAPAPAQGVTLADLAAVTGVTVPVPGVTLTDEQIDVVLRHLRYSDDPPMSYRQAVAAFREAGFVGSEERVRRIWAARRADENTPN